MLRLGLALGLVALAALGWRMLARRARTVAPRRPEETLVLAVSFEPPSGSGAEARARRIALCAELTGAAAGVGELEEPVGEGDRLVIDVYGRDAHALLEALRPVLARHPLDPASEVTLRRGSPGAPSETLALGALLAAPRSPDSAARPPGSGADPRR